MTSNNKHTDDLLAEASEFAEKVFKARGTVDPLWFAVDSEGVRLVVPPPVPYTSPEAKDIAAVLVRALFEIRGVIRYVYIAESWYVDSHPDRTDVNPTVSVASDLDGDSAESLDMDTIQRDGISQHPRRREVVLFMSETEKTGVSMAFREIIRPKKGRPRLGPLVVQSGWNQIEGRFASMLPRTGRPS